MATRAIGDRESADELRELARRVRVLCVGWWPSSATEAEWEYAAAGGSENRLYPWGERGAKQNAGGAGLGILFGGSINLNPHTHGLALDGVYHNGGHRAVFSQVRAPSDTEVADVVRRIQVRVIRTLKRRGLLRDPADSREPGNDDPMARCGQLSLRIGKLGRVDEQGRVLPDDDDVRFGKRGKRLCADIDGWPASSGTRMPRSRYTRTTTWAARTCAATRCATPSACSV